MHDSFIVLLVLDKTRRRETLVAPIVWIEHLLTIIELLIVRRVIVVLPVEVHPEALRVQVAVAIPKTVDISRLAQTPRVKLVARHLARHWFSQESVSYTHLTLPTILRV